MNRVDATNISTNDYVRLSSDYLPTSVPERKLSLNADIEYNSHEENKNNESILNQSKNSLDQIKTLQRQHQSLQSIYNKSFPSATSNANISHRHTIQPTSKRDSMINQELNGMLI